MHALGWGAAEVENEALNGLSRLRDMEIVNRRNIAEQTKFLSLALQARILRGL
jgi:hypothetical protein